MAQEKQNKITDTGQTVGRDAKGRFIKGNKPKNGFDKNPHNIAPGGLWRYKENGRSAIMDIFKMSMADFYDLEYSDDKQKTVLYEVLCAKFKSAMTGNSKDMDFLFNQVFGAAPTYREAQEARSRELEERPNPFDELTVEELRRLSEK